MPKQILLHLIHDGLRIPEEQLCTGDKPLLDHIIQEVVCVTHSGDVEMETNKGTLSMIIMF